MALTPRPTALDGDLAFKARVAAGLEPAERPAVRDFASRALSRPAAEAVEPGGQTTVKLLVEAGNVEAAVGWLEAQDGRLLSPDRPAPTEGHGLAVLVATVPTGAIAAADRQPWLWRMEGPRPLLPRLDEARGPVTGLDQALGAEPLSGEGVLLAVVDTGVDWRHPDFRHADGRSRLERFVHAHLLEGTEESRFDVFDGDALDDALDGGGTVPDGDPHGHGTHCASIAGGNGNAAGGRFRGVAPGAALMAMRSEPLLDTHTIEGIRQAFELADGRPAVVSLSLGGHLGPHDGTSAIENAIARMSGPGRIVVVAAGNEGTDKIHHSVQLVEGADAEIAFRIGDPDLQFVDVWIPRGDEVDLWVETPDGARHEPDGTVNSTVFGSFEADFREDRLNRDQNLTVFVEGGRVNHRWRILLRPSRVTHGEVHAWAGTVSPSTSAFLFPDAASPAYSIGMPGTEERAIVVGSFVSRNRFSSVQGEQVFDLAVGQLSPFSSHGPSRYGAQKPDVAAPGQYVTGALADGSHMATAPQYRPRHSDLGPYITIQGTSMATPFVAGLVALLLEREPTLNPEEIQQRLRVTARRDADTGRVWNPGFGVGKLDAQALLQFRS
jgi:subtilisin family serine protease